MKKLVLVLLTVLLVLSSCTLNKNICYYSYMEDSAFLLIYSAEKNTLYRIDIPVNTLALWARDNGYSNMKNVMLDYVSLKEDGFIACSKETHKEINGIIEVIIGSGYATTEQKMQAMVDKAYVFKEESILSSLNSLCSTDLSTLVKTVNSKKPEVCCIDAGTFLMKDSEYSQRYFKIWLDQLL